MPYWEIGDNPAVRNLCKTGYTDGGEPKIPRCPCCGEEADTFYVLRGTGEIVGCLDCIRKADAYECENEEE